MWQKFRHSRYFWPGLLLLQLLVFSGLNYCWLQHSELPWRHDSLIHSTIVTTYETPYDIGCPQPRLLHSLLALWCRTYGFSPQPFYLCEIIFLWIWVFGTYALGRQVRSPELGFLAATCLLWSAQATVAVRTFLLDYPYAALFTWQLWLYYKSERFTKIWATLLFCTLIPVISGLRYQYVLYAAPLLIFCALEQIHLYLKSRRSSGPRHQSAPFFLGAILGVVSTYVVHIIILHATLGEYATNNIAALPLNAESISSAIGAAPAWLLGHFVEIKWKNLQPLLFWLYITGWLALLFMPAELKRHRVILATLVTAALYFSWGTYDPPRFQAPLLALRCIVAAYTLLWMARPRLVLGLISAVIVPLGLIFNGGWLVPGVLPEARVAILQNDLIFDNACGGSFYDFTSPYVPSRRWDYTLSQASCERLCNWGSVWGETPFNTVPLYTVPWRQASHQLAACLDDPAQSYIYIAIDPPALKTDELTCNDELAELINQNWRWGRSSARPLCLALEQTIGYPQYIAVASDPRRSRLNTYTTGMQLLTTWTAPEIEISLWKRP